MPTFLRLLRLRALRGNRSGLDDFGKGAMCKILLPRLLIRVMLPRIFFERFELISLSSVRVDVRIEKLRGLLARVEHMLWRKAVGQRAPFSHGDIALEVNGRLARV